MDATAPFTVDLEACAFQRYAVPDAPGALFVLGHLADDGHCQVWVGYDDGSGNVHTDRYCQFAPSGSASVTATNSVSGQSCGGPGNLTLYIASADCIAM